MKVNYQRVFLLLLALVLLGAVPGVRAQEEEPGITLRLSRDFGYGSGIEAQGRFSYRVEGPDDLVRVEFYMDDTLIGTDEEAPFRLQFDTGQYELGLHRMSAIGYTAGGQELASNIITREFVSAETGIRSAVLTLGGAILLVAVFSVLSYVLTRRGGGSRSYGIFGAAVCVRCGRPVPFHFASPGLLVGRLVRCPHCGKWQVRPRATPQQLAAAEAFERELDEMDREVTPEEEAERRRRMIEESRYTD